MIGKANINKKLYDVVTPEEYKANPSLYDPGFTAIKKEDVIYPIRTKANSELPGFVDYGVIGIYTGPTEEDDKIEYSADNGNFTDFSNVSNMKEVLEKNSQIKEMERYILTSPDNITKLKVVEQDSPEMKLTKEAINLKNIDTAKYEDRFNGQINNDMRKFKKDHSLTVKKLITFGNIFDIEFELIARDKNPDVANPMGKEIRVILNGDGGDDENDEQS